jgi:ketosteroid isomerase-like protein
VKPVVQAFADSLVAGAGMQPTLADDIVMRGTLGGLDEQLVLNGRDAVIAYFREIAEPWDRVGVEIERVAERDDVFVILMRETGVSAHSSVELSSQTAIVGRVSDGGIVELRGYLDQAAALRVAGVA